MKSPEVRSPVVAGQFYEGSRAALQKAVQRCAAGYKPPDDLAPLLGGVVPHAGWVFSGPTAAKVFVALAQKAKPETYLLLGAVHRWGGSRAAVYPAGAWLTPLGEAEVDGALAAAIVEAGRGIITASASAHAGEHSIEVQVPFVQAFSPGARILPIAVPPSAEAAQVGEALALALASWKGSVAVVASTDLTHYGMGYGGPDYGPLTEAMPWMRENDHRIIRLVESLSAEKIVPEAQANCNACGSGALAAATAAARALGATRARALEYTTSAEVVHEPDADRAVGYVGMVFEKAGSAGC